jgi:hypothetical protein
MRLTERPGEIVDLLGQPRLLPGRPAVPVAMLKALPAAREELLLPRTDEVSDTPWRRAASACVLSPCKTNSTIFSLTSTGCFGGRATASPHDRGVRAARAVGSPVSISSPYGLASLSA